MKVTELMTKECVTIYEGDTIEKAISVMAKEDRGMLVVLENALSKKVVGVVTNKDVINKVISKDEDPASVRVSEIMTDKVVSLPTTATSSDAMIKMDNENIKRVLILDDDILQGVISTHDVIAGMLKHKKELLDMALDF